MWRAIASNGITLLIVLMIAAAGLIGWGQAQYRGAGPLTAAMCLQVATGATMTGVADELAESGAVSQAWIFRAGADYEALSGKLKAGSWLLPAEASMAEIADIVTRGGASTCGNEVVYRIGVTRNSVRVREFDPGTDQFVELITFDLSDNPDPQAFALYEQMRDRSDTRFRIVVAEGVTSWQVTQGLNAIDVLTGQIGAKPAEGSLAPDSYEVSQGDDRRALVDEMRAAQSARIAETWEARDPDLPYESVDEAVIMASIIEKETGRADERRQVAAVFVNRLRDGWRLQTDPTVIYGITEGRGVLGRGLRQSELDTPTQYNTYVIYGLPPTPIANPGLASLEAAVNPDESDYMFFVAKSLNPADGHNFAVTNAEHEENVAKYRALEEARDGN
ncbi:MAG: endolytic transglycosylase MltG [Pseudomonadota bacterium]